MAKGSGIEWCSASWNPVTGCKEKGIVVGRSPHDYEDFSGFWFVTIEFEDGTSECLSLKGGLHANPT